MIFTENTSFACNNIKIYVCVTSGAVLLTGWVDLDTTFAVQLRETARVLGSQGAPAESDVDSVRASTQGILSDFRHFSLIFIDFRRFSSDGTSDGQFCEHLPRKIIGWEFIPGSTGSSGSSGSGISGGSKRAPDPTFTRTGGQDDVR